MTSRPLPPRHPDWRTRLHGLAAAAWGRPKDGIPFMTRGARYSVVFLFLLAFALAAGSYRLSVSAVDRAVADRASVVQLCQLGNASRAQQVILWTHLIKVSLPPPHETAAERARRQKTIREFLAFVHHDFAPRNCAARLSGGRP